MVPLQIDLAIGVDGTCWWVQLTEASGGTAIEDAAALAG